MKNWFWGNIAILEPKPDMKKLILTRDSVSMGDDAFDHTLEIEIKEEWKINEILDKVIQINYLPKIMGGKATWSVAYDKPLAIIAQQSSTPKLIGMSEDFPYQGTKWHVNIERLHFNYHAQQDPELVYDVLNRFHVVRKG